MPDKNVEEWVLEFCEKWEMSRPHGFIGRVSAPVGARDFAGPHREAIIDFIRTLIQQTKEQTIREMVRRVPELPLLPGSRTCIYHDDYKCAVCCTHNEARNALIAYAKEQGIDVRPSSKPY